MGAIGDFEQAIRAYAHTLPWLELREIAHLIHVVNPETDVSHAAPKLI